MTIQEMLKEKNMSVYKLSKASTVPYATCNDIVSGKAQLEKCSAETVYKIAQTLNVSMESILAPYFVKRSSFENFKSTICHRVKELGDIDFIIDTLESQDIALDLPPDEVVFAVGKQTGNVGCVDIHHRHVMPYLQFIMARNGVICPGILHIVMR